MQGVGLLLWYLAGAGGSASVLLLTIFAIVFGIGYGGYVSMIAPIIAEYFGTARIGSLLGIFMSSIAIGAFFGPWLMGQAFDTWGSYDIPIIASGLLGLVATAAAMMMPAKAYPAARFARADA